VAHNLNLGQKIKRYRLMNDIRQEDMADKMEISRATLINYEKGHTTINMDVLDRLIKSYPDFQIEEKDNLKPKIIDNNIIDFKVLFNVLSQSKRNIFFIAFFTSIFGLGISFLFTKYYSAEISLYPAKKDLTKGLSQFQSLAVNLGMNMAENDQDFNIPDVVKSRLIANKVINQSWLAQNGLQTNLIELWDLNKIPFYVLNKNTIDSSYVIEKAINKFNDHIEVSENSMSGLITIIAIIEDPLIAANIANFIGNQVQLYIQKENSAQSTKEKFFISDRLAIVKSELELAELELKDFKERNRGYEDSPELFMVFSQLFREVEAKKQVYLTLQQQLELARIEEVKQSPILHVLDHAVPPSRKSSPNRVLFLISFLFLGFICSSLRIVYKY
tara:strand:- start:16601 stop:17764 length:1164 start_codon:yes stop_codon:yes gene_type:complete